MSEPPPIEAPPGSADESVPIEAVIPVIPVRPITPVVPVIPVGPVSPVVPIGAIKVVPQRLPVVLKLPPWASPVLPGTVGPQPVSIDQPTLEAAIVSALGTPYAPVDATPPSQVVWFDHDGEVLAQLDATTVTLFDGLILVSITLLSVETGAGQVTVPLTVGSSTQPVGLLVGTELRPRGPLLLVDRWGEAVTAAAWRALLDVARNLGQQGGADSNGVPFIPAAMTATPTSFSVLPQARQAMDSAVTV